MAGTPVADAPLGSAFVPPAGRYAYEASGYTQSADGRSEETDRQVDEVSVRRKGGSVDVRIVTRVGERSEDEVLFDVGASTARISRIVSTQGKGLTAVSQTIVPDPPIPVARLPYRVGERWTFQWRDDAAGVRARGAGSVVGLEDVTTPAGVVRTVVVDVEQELAGGPGSGRRRSTLWINPETGVRVKRHLVAESTTAFGETRTEVVSTLVEGASW